MEVVVYKFREREGYEWMHKQILKIEFKKKMASFPPCVFQPQNFIHTIQQHSSMCKNIDPNEIFLPCIYIPFNLSSTLGAHIQTIPGHFDPFSSIICDMGSNKFQ